MMVHVNCNLCGRDDWEIRFPATMHGGQLNVNAFSCTNPGYGHHPQIVQCRHCAYVYANPRWSSEDLIEAYTAVEDETYVMERQGRELTFRKHLQELEKRTGPANGRLLLDVGAYIGVFVEVAAEAGWNAWGVEPSQWAAAEAQNRGLSVIFGTQDAPELAERQFDVVTMWDVIEHVDDPSAELAKAHRLLKPGGWLVVHTMDIDSLAARLLGARWPWLMDMHLHYFSQKTLAQMLKNNGYEILWSGPQGRYLRLNYLASRIGGFNRYLGHLATKVINGLRLGGIAIPINFRDLFTVYARRP
jgi:2-polyprenyl-3-methyl-5-hydroxy-6-metoxy-1,4-benzoquinol methylase